MDGKELLQELLRRYPDQRVSEDPAGAGMLSSLGAQQPEPMTGAGLQTAGGSLTEEAAGAQVIGRRRSQRRGRPCRNTRRARRRWTSASWRTSCGSAWGTGRTAKTR